MAEQQLFLFDDGAPAPDIPGLHHERDFIDEREERALVAAIDAAPWEFYYRRRIQQYGLRYENRVEWEIPQAFPEALPAWSDPLVARLIARGHLPRRPEQLGVNEYEPGQGIALHVDRPWLGESVAIVSLLSPAEMQFRESGTRRETTLDLAPRSLLVLSGPARRVWLHGIRPRLKDGDRPRRRRVSLTFRLGGLASDAG